jgi:NAD(P)-dependent dehydrogenase (short-subunit alcohol dehydrogenase family)
MVNVPFNDGVWVLGAEPGAQALAQALRDQRLHVLHAADAKALAAAAHAEFAGAPSAFVYVAPRAPSACEGVAIHTLVNTAVCSFVAGAQQAVRRMSRRTGGGAIVVVTDIAGIPGRSGHAATATLSGALIGAAKCLAKELGRNSISVNTVAYGFMPDLGAADGLRPAERKLFEMMNLGKPGSMRHLVANVLHLVGNQHLMTGQVLHADDGLII